MCNTGHDVCFQNQKYYLAISKAVQLLQKKGQGVRVLDIGTGTGLLSMMAATVGADSVTACEVSTSQFAQYIKACQCSLRGQYITVCSVHHSLQMQPVRSVHHSLLSTSKLANAACEIST